MRRHGPTDARRTCRSRARHLQDPVPDTARARCAALPGVCGSAQGEGSCLMPSYTIQMPRALRNVNCRTLDRRARRRLGSHGELEIRAGKEMIDVAAGRMSVGDLDLVETARGSIEP